MHQVYRWWLELPELDSHIPAGPTKDAVEVLMAIQGLEEGAIVLSDSIACQLGERGRIWAKRV